LSASAKIKTSLSASVKTTIIAATLISGTLLAGMLVSPSQEVFAQVAEGPSCLLLEDESVECDDDRQ
jgi:hypothetical protein